MGAQPLQEAVDAVARGEETRITGQDAEPAVAELDQGGRCERSSATTSTSSPGPAVTVDMVTVIERRRAAAMAPAATPAK